jgi:hypothetical protein
MEKYPAEVLRAAIRSLRRSQRFFPAIAEFVGAAEEEMDQIRSRLRLVREHEREHARRARVAQLEEQRRAEDRRKRQRRLDDLIAIYGPTFSRWTADDVADAGTGLFEASLRTLRAWADATEAADLWAPAAMPLAIVAGRAWPLHRDGHLPAAALCRLFQIARADPESALALVSDLIATSDPGHLPPMLTGAGLDEAADDWGNPRRFLANLFAEIRRECSSAREEERTDDHPNPTVTAT